MYGKPETTTVKSTVNEPPAGVQLCQAAWVKFTPVDKHLNIQAQSKDAVRSHGPSSEVSPRVPPLQPILTVS